MHRSGTSLITSWLESSGLVTHDGDFHGPSVGNPKGNFEDKAFVDIQIAELKSRYPDSKGWQIFSPDELAFSKTHRLELETLVQTRSGKYAVWGWKDPRSTFFLEDWKNIIPGLKLLFLWRPCGEVVRSLVERSAKAKFDVFKVEKEQSLAMWISYNTLILRFMRNHPDDSLLFNTRDIISNGVRSFDRVNGFLDQQLSYSDFMNTFDTTLFNSSSMDISQYHEYLEPVEAIQAELALRSEK
jgi:hypothetical protein